MLVGLRKMNRRIGEAPGSLTESGNRDKGSRQSKFGRGRILATRVLLFTGILYLGLLSRLNTSQGYHRDKTSIVHWSSSLFTQPETSVGIAFESMKVDHIPVRSDTGLFVTMGSYIMDGDADAGTHPSLKTNDIILLIVGAGDFGKSPQPRSDAELKRPPPVPSGLACILTDTTISAEYRFDTVNFHRNGTAYEGKISQTRGALLFGERAIWISCPVPRTMEELRSRLIAGVHQFQLRVVIDMPSGQRVFDSQPTAPSSVLSFVYPSPLHNLTLCTSAIYGLTSTKWLIEYIEYHRAAGFDSMDLYVHEIGDLPKAVLDEYIKRNSESFFIRIHNWTRMLDNGPVGFNTVNGVGRGVQGDEWEHGQRLTRNDCYLRNRGRSKWIMFCDVDELFTSALPHESSLYRGAISEICEESYLRDNMKIACSFSSVTVPPDAKTDDATRLILERIDTSEASCQSPYNCGRFHYGREKYAIRTMRGSLNPNGPFFYHAVSRNYDVSEPLHVLVPSSVAYVRHYAGHFSHSRKGGLPLEKRKYNPLPPDIIRSMREIIYQEGGELSRLYALPNQKENFLKLDRITDMWRFAKSSDFPSAPLSAKQGEQTSEIASKHVKYMTFEYFGGRLNNQLWTFDWVFRTALALDRTVVIGMPKTKEHYIGFPSSSADGSLWDLDILRQAPFQFKFDWELEDPGDKDMLLGDHRDLPVECIWTFSEANKHVVHWATQVGCKHRRLHFVSGGGLIHSYKADTRVYGVDPLVYWRHMRLHPDIVALVQKWWSNLENARGPLSKAVGLHFRSWREANGDAAHATKVCRRLSQKLLINAGRHFSVLKADRCQSSCKVAHEWVDVEEFWRSNGLDETCLPATSERIKTICDGALDKLGDEGEFFVATDHEAKEVDDVFRDLNARMISGIDIDSFVSRIVEQTTTGISARRYARGILPILLDVSALIQSGHFVGSPASTLSQAVCLWRRAMYPNEPVPVMCRLVWYSTFSDVCDELCIEDPRA